MLKILNLYAGIGGNRKLWNDAFRGIQVTAIENNEDIANLYNKFFPNDTVLVADAHEYLQQHFNEFTFIWSSPPCQTHSSFRQNIGVRYRGVKPVYPDMRLYQEILFLRANYKGMWVVENVKPYYEPLIRPSFVLGRHLFWSNTIISESIFKKDNIRKAQINDFIRMYGFDVSKENIKNKRQVLRNCVEPNIGKYVLENIVQETWADEMVEAGVV